MCTWDTVGTGPGMGGTGTTVSALLRDATVGPSVVTVAAAATLNCLNLSLHSAEVAAVS